MSLNTVAEADHADLDASAGGSILVEGDTCWRRPTARRAAALVDAADYFGALRSSLLKAERSIFILGWELNSKTCLRGQGDPDDRAPVALGKLLKWLLRRKKNLRVRILLWNHSMFYSPMREKFPRFIFGWRKPRRVEIELDAHLPLGAAHHEKVVIIDDCIAYCGGMDLTLRRWDTQEHRPVEPQRCDPSSQPYVPVHDVQMVVEGEAAAALSERARERWKQVTGRTVGPVKARTGDCWPRGTEADFEDVPVGVMRTLPALEDNTVEVREVERSTAAAIARAEKFIYIENQYITSKTAMEALRDRMRSNPALEVVVISSCESGGWLEAETMGVGRQRFMAAFDEPHLKRRIRFLYPFARGNPGDDEYEAANKRADGTFTIHVHAKVLVIDDVFLRIGSSNLNNRSMGFDTECDIGIEATTPEQRKSIATIRNKLIAEHWGAEPAEVERAFAASKSTLVALTELESDEKRRGVAPIEREPVAEGDSTLAQLGDPEYVVTAEKFVQDMAGFKHPRKAVRWVIGLVTAVALVVGLALLVKHLPLDGAGFTERVSTGIESLRGSPWRVPLVLVAFVLGSIVSFPILVMIGATVVALGPLLGFACAAVGSMLAATATFQVGRLIGRKPLRRWLGRRAQLLEQQLTGRGIITVALIRKVPIAPFTVVNMLIGASGLSYREFITGTAIGMLPGIAAFALVGDRAMDVWRNPTPLNVTLVAGAIVAWIGVVLGIQKLMNRYAKK